MTAAGEDMLALILIADGHRFALPVAAARDLFRPGPVSPVPLAPRGIAGVLNLRGRIVTAICLRASLGLPVIPAEIAAVLENEGERYAILADAAGDVVRLHSGDAQSLPPAMSAPVAAVASGLYRDGEGLVTLLDPDRLLAAASGQADAAA
ncbi:chemotaxis protein CheW [Futiania mangrovi]|uniref:Chemotaxis protein CheW n=1 Tax=Futiania mangrovi TaxID=2959716 RepID=A0A9J6PFM7_9PROT|nr:chemotaxis protein CheW [Futiania mangrovii]MCP1334914.1 chemotaxis protein CheW [Futiania mangrovii]